MSSTKSDLTHDEKLRAAYAYLINNVAQHHIAALYGVNQGRVSEAVALVAKAVNYPGRTWSAPKDVSDEFGMPYTPADVSFFKKGATPESK